MDRNPDEFKTGFRPQPHPHIPFWLDPASFGPFPPLHPVHHYYAKSCCCSDILYIVEKKLTAIQYTLENMSGQPLNIPHEPIQSPATSRMSQPGSVDAETNFPVTIPPTARQRRELIKRMEQELEARRKANRAHEEKIAGLRLELQQLKEKNSK